MNATDPDLVVRLTRSGLQPSVIAEIAGVHRSSVARWIHGSTPRAQARKRLERAEALLRGAQLPAGQVNRWFRTPHEQLSGLRPAQWLADDRDIGAVAEVMPRHMAKPAPRAPADVAALATTLAEFKSVSSLVAGLNLAPILASFRLVNGLDRQAAMLTEVANAPLLLEATGIARSMAMLSETWSEMLKAPLLAYRDAYAALAPSLTAGAFAGMTDILRTLNQPTFTIQRDLIAQLVANQHTAIGSLGVAMDLQLGGAFAAATRLHRGLIAQPFTREVLAWRAWLPEHPNGLIRQTDLRPEWLAGQAHIASRATVAAISRRQAGVDSEEVSAALAGVTRNVPDLLSMKVAGTGLTLVDVVKSAAPGAVEPLEAGWDRVWTGGKDAARQGAASLRAALDQIASAIAPAAKNNRESAYRSVLELEPGDATTKLLSLQVSLLYVTYQPLSTAIHDEADIDAIKALALGLVSSLAGILARWSELQARRTRE